MSDIVYGKERRIGVSVDAHADLLKERDALRAEVEQYRETLDRQIGLTIQTAEDHQVVIDRLSAEVEKLRAALERAWEELKRRAALERKR